MIPFANPDENKFNIFFIARNGSWNEELRFEKVEGSWEKALRVQGGFFGSKKRISYEMMTWAFPLNKLDRIPSPKALPKTH